MWSTNTKSNTASFSDYSQIFLCGWWFESLLAEKQSIEVWSGVWISLLKKTFGLAWYNYGWNSLPTK